MKEAQQSSQRFSDHTKRISTGLKTLGAVAAGGAAVGIGLLVRQAKDWVAEARDANKVGAQTVAALKSTHGAAGLTAKSISDLAGKISNLTGIDDDLVQGGENILLTFRALHGDVFKKTTAAAVDMASAMNHGVVTQEGLQSSAILLGKALSDPTKGLSALTRVGVTFDKGQRDQIATWVKHGQTAKAQAAILKEVNTEFGGSAAAAATNADKLGVTIGNIKEALGNKFIPAIEAGARLVNEKLIPAAQSFWKDHGPKLSSKLADLRDKLADLLSPTQLFGDRLGDASISAKDLSDELTTTIEFAGKMADAARKAGDYLNYAAGWSDYLGTALHARLQLAFLEIAEIAGNVSKFILNIGVAAGMTGNVIDRFSGGSGHAFDSFVAGARNMRDQTDTQLHKIRDQIKSTKTEIAGLHAPKLVFTGQDKVTPVVSQIMKEMKQRGFSVTARLVRGGTAQKGTRVPGYGGGDRHPYLLEGGETVVPKELTPEIAPWARARGIPGFRHGGVAGRTWPARVNLAASHGALMDRASFAGFAGGAASGNVIRLALAQAKRMAASFKVALALIEAGIVESGLRNLNYGDRDSLGFLQQRPSQGWKHPMNISYAAWDFLHRAIPIQDRYGTAGMLAQAVQRSAFPGRYDQQQARALGILHAYNYDRGGTLAPGLNLMWNGTGRREELVPATTVGPTVVNIYPAPGMSERRVGQIVVEALDERDRRARKGGRP
jgi:hypothetical protein